MNTVLGLLAVLALVFMNGFFVSAEFAFVGSRRTRIAQMAQEGSAGAKAAQSAMNHLDQYIAATQLGITLASLGLGWIGEPAVAGVFEPLFEHFLPEATAVTVGHTVSVVIAFSLVTMLHIVLGELAPKSIALQRPEDVAVIVARPTILFHDVFKLVINLMNSVGNMVVRRLGFEPASEVTFRPFAGRTGNAGAFQPRGGAASGERGGAAASRLRLQRHSGGRNHAAARRSRCRQRGDPAA